jgi:hypothetical protein
MSLEAETAAPETAVTPEVAAPAAPAAPETGALGALEAPSVSDLAAQYAAELNAEEEAPAPAKVAPAEVADEPAEVEAAPATRAAPDVMSEADKALFATLPPEAQAWVNKRAADMAERSQAATQQAQAAFQERQAIQAQLQQYDQFLSTLTSKPLQPPPAAMQQTDPLGYQDAMADYIQQRHSQEQAQQEQARIRGEHQQIQRQQYQEFTQVESRKLLELMPEFNDAKQGLALRKAVIDYAQKQGFAELLPRASAQEIAVLTKAMRYDAGQAALKAAKPVTAPPPKAAKPGPARAPGNRSGGIANAVTNLSSNPSRDALAAAYMAEIQAER